MSFFLIWTQTLLFKVKFSGGKKKTAAEDTFQNEIARVSFSLIAQHKL